MSTAKRQLQDVKNRRFGRMSRRKGRLVDFFRKWPLAGVGLELERSNASECRRILL